MSHAVANTEQVLGAQLLGRPRLFWQEQRIKPSSQKGLALLYRLAAAPEGMVRADLAELFWGVGKTKNLRQELYNLRQLPGAEHWLGEDEALAIRVRSDLAAFQRALEGEHYAEALAQWRGPFLEGFELANCPAFSNWLSVERQRLDALYLDVLQCRALELEVEGNYPTALSLMRTLLEQDNLNETAHRVVMRLESLQGRPQAALAQYEHCRRILAEELGVEPLAETEALLAAIQQGPAELPTSRHSSSASASSLADKTARKGAALNWAKTRPPFLGRAEELTTISARLSDPDCRLLTLVGPGGIGKTRLALELAERHKDHFEAVYVVSLAPVASADLIVSVMAGSLGLVFGDLEDSRTQLLRALSAQRALLVLDNFEHLLTGAGLLSEILAHAPQVKLLVTSRERLGLQREWLYEVRGMAYPKVDDAPVDEAALERYDALRLFIQTARRTRHDFRVGAASAPHIVRICQLLQGFPLAIELAAAWVRLLSCEQIAAELSRSPELLSSGSSDIADRHRSMRVVFDHSWDLLMPLEREALAQLAVFRGGFGREAAQLVADVPLYRLLKLIDKSLIYSPSPGRFEMLEPLRHYALERLTAYADLKAETLTAHCHYYSRLMERQGRDLEGGHAKQALGRVSEELDNIRAAWHYATLNAEVSALARAAKGLSTFYDLRGFFQEGADAFMQAAAGLQGTASEETRDLTLAWLQLRASWFFFRLGRYPEVQTLLKRSLAIFERYDRARDVATCLYQLGNVAEALGDYQKARSFLERSLACYRKQQVPGGIARALNSLGLVAYALGDYEQARRLHLEGLPLREDMGDPRGLVIGYNNLGDATLRLGDHTEAARLYQRGLDISQQHGDTWGRALSQNHLGDAAFAEGHFAKAEAHYREGVRLCEEIGLTYALGLAVRGLGRTCAALGRYDEASTLLTRSLDIAATIDATPQTLETLVALAQLFERQGDDIRSLELSSFVLAQELPQTQTRDDAQQLVEDLSGRLEPTAVSEVLGRSKQQRLEGLVQDLLQP